MSNSDVPRANPTTNINGPQIVKSLFVVNAYTEIAIVTAAVENAAAKTI